jgi:hypothetical protein
MNAEDEMNITEIEVLSDGRICVFGTSLEVLEILDAMQGGQDQSLTNRFHAIAQHIAIAAKPNDDEGSL